MTYIKYDILIRSLAILAVVFNHAFIDRHFAEHGNVEGIFYGLGLGGGALTLLVLSGFSFTDFILRQPNARAVKRGIVAFGRSIFIPSFCVVIFFFIILGEFDLQELLFYKNWITSDRVSKFPTWYPQVIVQLLIFLFLVIPLFDGVRRQRPLCFALLFLAIALAAYFLVPVLWPPAAKAGKLPHQFLWVFVLGWLIFYAKQHAQRPLLAKLVTSALLVFLATLLIAPDTLHYYWLTAAGLGLIWLDSVPILAALRPVVYLISQSTFTLFLFHRFFFEVFERIYPFAYTYLHLFAFALVGCVSLWIAKTSFQRAYAKLHIRPAPTAMPAPKETAQLS